MNDLAVRPELIAMTIPILLMSFVAGIIVLYFLFRYLRRRRLFELYHQERMAAIGKGMEVPSLPEALLRESGGATVKRPASALLKGLIWLFGGAGLFVALWAEHAHEGFLALIPMGIGLAYLIYYMVEGRRLSMPAPTDFGPGAPLALPAKP